MISTPLTTPPTAPSRSDPTNFRSRADLFFDWLSATFPNEMNSIITDFNATIENLFVATSTSSVAIGTGSKSFTVAEENLAFGVGSELRIAETANPTVNYMDGIITAYTKATKSLTVAVSAVAGSGTISAWTLTLKPRDFSSRVQAWSELTGAASPPLVAWHGSRYWALMSALADATASEPGAGNTDWIGVGELLKYEEITTSVAAWAPLSTARWLVVEIVGAGGSGGRGTSYVSGGGGGMGMITILPVSRLTFPVAITIGAGGSAVSAGTGKAGGNTEFGAIVMPGGYVGGISNSAITTYRFPGVLTDTAENPRSRVWTHAMPRLGSSTPDVTTIFGGGSGGGVKNDTWSIQGGTSLFHGSGGASNATDQNDAHGEDGQFPGGGGGGARSTSGVYSKHSGAGADGVVRIWQF